MDINEAKTQVKRAVKAYLSRDSYGRFTIPLQRQRPILLIGAPGIGKTDIMEQISSELGIGLVSYSMTHHTRQSALGLPLIVHKTYGGQDYEATEYTMSEIIASIYELMEDTGVSEGILFLDEINCVSETLAPSMLQFLQYKTFGKHRVPDGWIIVTAGNPPEYNRSVHEFDIVTLDRIKKIVVEPDYDIWRTYALDAGVHDCVTSFLDLNKDCFYVVEKTAEGKQFVTARSWVDLANVIAVYEQEGLEVDLGLIEQYLQHPRIAEEFSMYYELYQRYRSEYGIAGILAGDIDEGVLIRARQAELDERLSVMSILLDAASDDMRATLETNDGLIALRDCLRQVREQAGKGDGVADALDVVRIKTEREIQRGIQAHSITEADLALGQFCVDGLKRFAGRVREAGAQGDDAFAVVKEAFDPQVEDMKRLRDRAQAELANIFAFVKQAYGEGQEVTLLVTELTARYHTSQFISKYGSDEYFAHNADLLVHHRSEDLQERIQALDL